MLDTHLSRRIRKAIALIVAGIVATLATLFLSVGTAQASTSDPLDDPYNGPGSLTWFEIGYCAFHAGACDAAEDAAAWAGSITAWKFPGVVAHNNTADAFRHCSWAGAMTQRLGYGQAVEILSNHEVQDSTPQAEYDMDISNNAVGATLGNVADDEGGSDTWGWIMNECETLARSGQLTTIE